MTTFDQALFRWINGLTGRVAWLDSLATFLASDFFLPVLIATAAWSLWFLGRSQAERLQSQMGALYAGFGAGIANLAIHILNLYYYYRPRPFIELEDVTVLFYRATDSSFPSNAAAFSFAMAAGVWLVHRRLGVMIGVAALVFSAARVYAGMHYPLDVLGGAILGMLTAYLAFRALSLMQPVVHLMVSVARFFYLA